MTLTFARTIVAILLLLPFSKRTDAFVIQQPARIAISRQPICIQSSSSSSSSNFDLPDLQSMKVKEMRNELESYGISTKSFLEKKELLEALQQARAEGKQNISSKTGSSTSRTGTDGKTSSDQSQNTQQASTSRQERYQQAFEKAKSMKTGELKQELQSMGMDCKSFFEKSEFVQAYANAVADGVQKKGSSQQQQQQAYDSSYRDVVIQKMQARDKQIFGSTVIDVPARV